MRSVRLVNPNMSLKRLTGKISILLIMLNGDFACIMVESRIFTDKTQSKVSLVPYI